MQYIIRSLDKADSLSIRLANRDKHVEYVKSQSVKLLLAGPLIDDISGDPIGTLLIVEASERNDVENYAENDPYNKAGLFKESQITAINITVTNLG
ncbi:MAG: YciI family protein [Pseudomonadota bacterium]|nr:YciI family protein [Pseudomonadota bacterium]